MDSLNYSCRITPRNSRMSVEAKEWSLKVSFSPWQKQTRTSMLSLVVAVMGTERRKRVSVCISRKIRLTDMGFTSFLASSQPWRFHRSPNMVSLWSKLKVDKLVGEFIERDRTLQYWWKVLNVWWWPILIRERGTASAAPAHRAPIKQHSRKKQVLGSTFLNNKIHNGSELCVCFSLSTRNSFSLVSVQSRWSASMENPIINHLPAEDSFHTIVRHLRGHL